MKTGILTLFLLGFASSVMALGPADLDNRIRMLTDKFDSYQHQPDKRIPSDILGRAKGIILLDRTKAGFLFAYQGGAGVAMVKDPALDTWGPAAFLTANQASLGFQVGEEQHFYIILLMTTNSTKMLIDKNFSFGGEARGTAGDVSNGVETKTPQDPAVLVYEGRQGLYGGASIKGGAITPDDNANHVYYGQYVSMSDILFDHKVQPTEMAAVLAKKIQSYSHPVLESDRTANR